MGAADTTIREKYQGRVGAFVHSGAIEVPVCAACARHRKKIMGIGLLAGLLLVLAFFAVLSLSMGLLDSRPGLFLGAIGGYLVLNVGTAVGMAVFRRTWADRHPGHVHPIKWVKATPSVSPFNANLPMVWLHFSNPRYAAEFAEANPQARAAGLSLEAELLRFHNKR